MTSRTTRTLPSMPGLAGLYARALTEGLPFVGRGQAGREGQPPRLRVEGVPVDPDHLAAYRRLCGFAPGDTLPATYPQTLAFPLILALLTDPAFPFPAMGTVHLGNRIRVTRRLEVGDVLAYEITSRATTLHPRGPATVLAITATSDGEVVWDADMTLLRRKRVRPAALGAGRAQPDVPADPPRGPAAWALSADLGRRYAALSGDRNPIHLTDLTAKPFGFSRHIAHGMWTHARALAELDNRLPDAYTVEVAFKKPVTLP